MKTLDFDTAQELFDLLTETEMAHHLQGCRHWDYLCARRRTMRGALGREVDRLLKLGPQKLADWMEIFLAEFNDCLEQP